MKTTQASHRLTSFLQSQRRQPAGLYPKDSLTIEKGQNDFLPLAFYLRGFRPYVDPIITTKSQRPIHVHGDEKYIWSRTEHLAKEEPVMNHKSKESNTERIVEFIQKFYNKHYEENRVPIFTGR